MKWGVRATFRRIQIYFCNFGLHAYGDILICTSIAGADTLPPQTLGTILETEEIPHRQDDGLGQPNIVNIITKCGLELMRFVVQLPHLPGNGIGSN